MTPEQTLSALGFPVARIGLIRATTLFQQGYNVDGGLTIDGQYGPLTRHAAEYSLAHGKACSAHFTWDEFACQCHGKYGCDVIWVQRRLLIALERLRTACYPQGLTVVSGCRCEKRNAEVGGAPSSQHVLGVAADVPPVALKETVMNLRVFGGVGYSPSRDRFRVCHVDLRPGTPISFPDGP